MGTDITLPRDVVLRALQKARSEYVRVAEEAGFDPGPSDECWVEFEALADAVEDIDPFERLRLAHLRRREEQRLRLLDGDDVE
jgi:hypothetical protein